MASHSRLTCSADVWCHLPISLLILAIKMQADFNVTQVIRKEKHTAEKGVGGEGQIPEPGVVLPAPHLQPVLCPLVCVIGTWPLVRVLARRGESCLLSPCESASSSSAGGEPQGASDGARLPPPPPARPFSVHGVVPVLSPQTHAASHQRISLTSLSPESQKCILNANRDIKPAC